MDGAFATVFAVFQRVRLPGVLIVCSLAVCSHSLVIVVLMRKSVFCKILYSIIFVCLFTGAHTDHAAVGVHVGSGDCSTNQLHDIHVHICECRNAMFALAVDTCVYCRVVDFVSDMGFEGGR
jgi:hypothetical protein